MCEFDKELAEFKSKFKNLNLSKEDFIKFYYLVDLASFSIDEALNLLESVDLVNSSFYNYVTEIIKESCENNEFIMSYFDYEAFEKDLLRSGDIYILSDDYLVANANYI